MAGPVMMEREQMGRNARNRAPDKVMGGRKENDDITGTLVRLAGSSNNETSNVAIEQLHKRYESVVDTTELMAIGRVIANFCAASGNTKAWDDFKRYIEERIRKGAKICKKFKDYQECKILSSSKISEEERRERLGQFLVDIKNHDQEVQTDMLAYLKREGNKNNAEIIIQPSDMQPAEHPVQDMALQELAPGLAAGMGIPLEVRETQTEVEKQSAEIKLDATDVSHQYETQNPRQNTINEVSSIHIASTEAHMKAASGFGVSDAEPLDVRNIKMEKTTGEAQQTTSEAERTDHTINAQVAGWQPSDSEPQDARHETQNSFTSATQNTGTEYTANKEKESNMTAAEGLVSLTRKTERRQLTDVLAPATEKVMADKLYSGRHTAKKPPAPQRTVPKRDNAGCQENTNYQISDTTAKMHNTRRMRQSRGQELLEHLIGRLNRHKISQNAISQKRGDDMQTTTNRAADVRFKPRDFFSISRGLTTNHKKTKLKLSRMRTSPMQLNRELGSRCRDTTFRVTGTLKVGRQKDSTLTSTEFTIPSKPEETESKAHTGKYKENRHAHNEQRHTRRREHVTAKQTAKGIVRAAKKQALPEPRAKKRKREGKKKKSGMLELIGKFHEDRKRRNRSVSA